MSITSQRVRWMIQTISDVLYLKPELVEDFIRDQNLEILQGFLDGQGPPRLLVYYQVEQDPGATDEMKQMNGAQPVIIFSLGDTVKIQDKGLFFMRVLGSDTKKRGVSINEASDNQITWGQITPNTVPYLNAMMQNFYFPALEGLGKEDWGVCEDESKVEFLVHTQKFAAELKESIKLMNPGQDLFKLDAEDMARINQTGNDNLRIQYYSRKFSEWVSKIFQLLNDDSDLRREKPTDGPHTELEYWRTRMQQITNWSEELKSKDFQQVKQTLLRHKQHEGQKVRGEQSVGKLISEYNRLDLTLTEKLNEAKDNVKYLTTLEKFIQPLYHGTPQQIIDTLPALMNAIKMIHTIARFYNTTDKMTNLFVKITNQMINNCKKRIMNPNNIPNYNPKSEEIWKRDPAELNEVLGSCIKLYRKYKECYLETKEKVADMPKGKSFDFSQSQIFGKFETFVRRLHKLIDIFSNIQQFQALERHNLEGMEKLTGEFQSHIDQFKKLRHDLLDINISKFDRDWVELNVEISHLDQELQNFIDNNFTRFKNIEYSLKLLKKFENTIKRESLKNNLYSKYNAILHNYATELDNINRIFGEEKSKVPPIVRNMPAEVGKIIWVRHLFQKITAPINMFPQNVLNSNEIQQYYTTYNGVGKQLTIYEMWYYQNWVNEIERSKAALQATLIVRHDQNNKLYVNFDLEIMQLIRQAKVLDRQGIEIPESARIILLQEDKFKMYYNELLYALKEYERILSKIKQICKKLLAPAIEDLELKMRPGMVTLTWTSMNIDSYLFNVHEGLKQLEQLIINVNDIIENRIENNLKLVSRVVLVDLPENTNPLTLDKFVGMQEDFIFKKTDFMMSKNVEVERSVDDLIKIIECYKLDPHLSDDNGEEKRVIKKYYFWYFYQALLNATQNSLNAMKYRVCGKKTPGSTSGSSLKPFFEVEVRLLGQEVRLSPTLDEIQRSINRAATAVLRCSRSLLHWDQQDKEIPDEKKATFYDMIAQDQEIVKVILLLTGSIQGTKNKVAEFLQEFEKFSWLYKVNITDDIKQFTKKGPNLQNYQDILKKFSSIEQEIDSVTESYQIGAMELKTVKQNTTLIIDALKIWAKEWKQQYSQDLHKRARTQLEHMTEQNKMLNIKLSKEVKDIDSLGYVMETLEQIKVKQAEIDLEFNPVLEMYQLLDNYLAGGITDKDEMDHRSMLRSEWDKVIKQADIQIKELQHKQGNYLKTLKRNVKDFVSEVTTFRQDYEQNGPMVEGIEPNVAMERLRRFQDQYQVKNQFFLINKRGQDLFGLQNQKYPDLEKTDAEIKNLKKLYGLYQTVIKDINNFKEKAWTEISKDDLINMEETAQQYADSCLRLPKDLKEWKAYKDLKTRIDNLRDVLPIIIDLKKPSIQHRHWEQISEITSSKLNYDNPENMFIEDLMDANLLNYQEDIVDICESADKQMKIRAQLDEITVYWDSAYFEYAVWGKRDRPCMLNGLVVSTVIERLEEDQMTLATLNAQRHVAPFKVEVETKIRVFAEVNDTLDLWVKVQKLWTSLEPVFTGGDIARQMPLQAKQFQGIDKYWMKIMDKAVETKKVVPCCLNDILKDFLPGLNEKLEDCQKMLEAYLEGKRKKFPRFYFVSNPTLLQILSQGSEPTSIQEDFEKLFDAINRVTFERNMEKKGSNEKMIVAIHQVMGKDEETVQLAAPVKCEGNIESWLQSLEHMMMASLRDIARSASARVFQTGLRDFVLTEVSQIALMGLQILWTTKINDGLDRISKGDRNAMELKKRETLQMMVLLSNMCLQDYKSAVDRTKIETLVTIQVHQKDITLELVDLKVRDLNDFNWQKQTRLLWKNEQDNCMIMITDWELGYSHEFLGSKERLCITPLTDRCYITLAQAMSMYYGGAPAGPAGTGKTETVKDLGRTLGVFVVVTNCSDQHRYKDMAKIFKGLCQSGLWGCFDEFNRIDLEVLSVVAMQVESITAAKQQNLREFMFPEEENLIELIESVGYFITMNPGYAGRQELPENLKVLFRGVTMMMPDREIIMKVKLASVGYSAIEVLAKKFNILYRLCQEQLSKQRHYDFGLRNILSVLRTAGNTKRQEIKSDEEMLLMRSLRDMNLSKLVADDIPLFNGLLMDIFPKQTTVPQMMYPDVEAKIPLIIKAKPGLVNTDSFQLKIIQLYETALVRHGYMLVGPTGSGKTTIMNVLTDCLSQLGQTTRIVKLNPKAITDKEMYGVKSEISDDWIPGVFSTIWEKSNNRNLKHTTWICCDGPVDAIWIENLNTVLDDNKILTLANGERILMTENCKMTFEVENLNNASPATVSRCGQVYISPTDLGYESTLRGWIKGRRDIGRPDEADKLTNILNKYLINSKMLELIDKVCKQPMMKLEPVCKVLQVLNLLTGCLDPYVKASQTLQEAALEKFSLFSIIWGVGGIYESNDRVLFHEYLISKGAILPQKSKENETVFDYYLTGENPEWKLIQPEEWKPPEKGLQFSQLLLPTLDSFRAEILLHNILTQPKSSSCNNAVLLIGGSGTAKTSSVLMYSNKFDREKMLFKRTNFSSATQPSMFQSTIEAECDFKVGKEFAPPGNQMMTLFIDDMSMPFVNKWGDQITLELVRQLIEQGGFYWLDKTQRGYFQHIQNLLYIGAMNHPGGGRNDIPNRLKRQFLIFNMILPLDIKVIYGPIIKHMFKPKFFSNEVNRVIDDLTDATITLWNKVKSQMLPTPSKFHYVFNMRELSRIFKGILNVRKDIINSTSAVAGMKPEVFMVGLWRHECERVFADKMVNNKDKGVILNFIQDISIDQFSNLESEINDKFNQPEKMFMFCDFLREDIKNEEGIVEVPGERIYEAINSMDKLKQRCYELLAEYNAKFPSKQMPLVLFDDATKHLLRISRIIKLSRSSALLVGVGGSGKQSLTRLAAEIGKHIVYQLTITKTYGEKDLQEDIKRLFDFSGHLGKHVSFLMTDSEVKTEGFLEYINMILSTGQIPGLLAKDEKEVWLMDCRNDYVKEKGLGNVDPPQSELWNYFVDRVRDNLHIVLCFSPVGQKFRERARKFPALFNECTIDWFLPWPEDALVSVAETFIKNFKELDTKEDIKNELMRSMGNVHILVNGVCDLYFQKMRRQVYVTPKSFLSYLNSYQSLYLEKYKELDIQGNSFKIGLNKIQEATVSIASMEVGLKQEENQLKEAADKTDKLLINLEKQRKKANSKAEEVEATNQQCKQQADMISREKELAEKDLEAAMPAMRRAQDAVDSLSQADIVEMKTNKTPLDIIKYIMDGVVVLFGVQLLPVTIEDRVFNRQEGKVVQFLKESWDDSGKSVLSDMNFLKQLKEYRKDDINDETIELMEPYLNAQADWFNEKTAMNASKAAAGIFKWAMAIYEYHCKSKIVKPKRQFLTIQQGRLEVALRELAKAQEDLAAIQALLAQLQETFNKQMEEKNQLEQKSQRTQKKINTARTLINSLQGEKERWGKGAADINEQKRRLVGNASLACAFISYCGPFNSEFRNLLANDYFINDMKQRGVPVNPNMGNELSTFLVDDATVGEWNLQGLPKDDLSIQNGIMVTNSSRFPLFIDPQMQGQNWIQNQYEKVIDPMRGITNLNHPRFQDYLKFCMEEGSCMIIENIENEVDPMLDPVLEKQIIVKGKTMIIDVGGTQIEYNKNFQLFMTCRLSNPAFSPELSAQTVIIDFTVTQGGLEQQLLGQVISKEQKALEESLNQLLTDVNQNQKDLQRLDKNLLERLTSSTGNLLDDTELMDVLNNTKTQAKEVAAKLIEAEVKSKDINEKREQYRPVAIRGSALYFTMIEVSEINWMYNSSLEQFLKLFMDSIDSAQTAALTSKRVENIIKELTFNVYKYVNRGLFEKDKITFILMVCFQIKQTDNKISGNDISLFLKAGSALDVKAERPQPFLWINDKQWMNILAISRHHFGQDPIPFFRELPELVVKNEPLWKAWVDKNDPENFPIPDFADRIHAEKDMGPFMELVLVRGIREDRTLVASIKYIGITLGKDYTAPISYPIDTIWQSSSNIDPVLFLLSAGADPTSTIDDLSRKKKKVACEKVSMGEGQEVAARQAIQIGFENGNWVILQNCHLGLKFMEELIEIVTPEAQIHEDFRLWITCEQNPRFPLGLLQKTIKVTNEPPKGLKAGLYKTFTTLITQDFLEKIEHPNWRSHIFTLCFLHSVVVERRKFGPLGWCVPYEYNYSDLEASLLFIEKYMNNIINTPGVSSQGNLPIVMNVVQYMVCEVQYGGRITDDLDRELFNAYGQEYLKADMFQNDHVLVEIPIEGAAGTKEKFKYKIPLNPNVEIQKYHEYISSSLPATDHPECFGLHANADLTFRLKQSLEMIITIMDTRPKDSSAGGGKSREEIVQDKARELLSKLPIDYIDGEVREKIKRLNGPKALNDKGLTVPLNIFLYQEIQRMQRVIGIVRKTFRDVIDAIDGQIIMTPEILDAINAVFDAQVPYSWVYDPSGAEISWILPTLGSWFTSLIDRNQQLYEWHNSDRPKCLWLTGFFNPQGFLTGMKQEVTRMHKKPDKGGDAWSLDDVTYQSEVTKEKDYENIREIQPEGVYIYGLFLEGCRWNRNSLDDAEPQQMFNPLNILYVSAQNSKQKDERVNNMYYCPVYQYPRRTDKYLVFRVYLACENSSVTKWQLRGVALLCSCE